MSPLAITWLLRLGGALLMMGVLTGTYYGWRSHIRSEATAPFIAAEAAQKKEAAALLTAETDKVKATETQLEFALLTQEKTDGLNKQKIAAGSDRLRALTAANAGRLRDPAGCGESRVGPANQIATSALDSARDVAEAGGLLSADLSGLLQRLTSEADTINAAYASCRADSLSIRDALK